MSIHPQLKGTLLVALSGILYGGLGFFGTKMQSAQIGINSMLFWRFFFAFIYMLLCTNVRKIDVRKLVVHKKDYQILIFAIFAYCLSSLFYFVACRYVGTGIGMVIFFSYPIFVTLFSWLFSNWRMNLHVFLSLSAVMIGLILLKGQGQQTLNALGIFWGLIASLSFAAYIYSSKALATKIGTNVQTVLLCFGNSCIFFILAFSIDGHLGVPVTASGWVYGLLLGIIATALPVQLLLDGLKYIGAIKAAVLAVLEPIVTLIVGGIFLHELISPIQFLGISVLLAGTLIMQFDKPAAIEKMEVQG